MAVKFTPQQQQVINLQDRNILVSAAAGSGKTAVLTERIIQMVCREENPVDIDRLLVVTFTNAAASEMRERISLGINSRLAQNPGSEHLQKQAALIHNAQITTIDSFCMFLLRNHFHQVGIDPAFRVMDEGERKLLIQDVMSSMLEEKFASKEEAFYHCVEYFCPGGKEKLLEDHILALYESAESYPWPYEWLQERKSDYAKTMQEELSCTAYGTYLLSHIHRMLEGCYQDLISVQDLCHQPDGPYMYGELIDAEIEMLEKLLTAKSLKEYEQKLSAVSFQRLSSKKDTSVNLGKRELAKELRSRVKETIKELEERFFATSQELAIKQSEACAEPVSQLIDLATEFRERLRMKKQKARLVDFADIEHYALDILLDRKDGSIRPSQVAMEYRQYFAEILIDEYQDSNLVQEYLLKAVSGEEEGRYNRFMVGDVKQSIYKFRLARPELFLEKYHTYKHEAGPCQRIDLSKNFRSRIQVVNTVNGIFADLMSGQIGGIDYDEDAMLYFGAVFPENQNNISELLLIDKQKELSPRQAEGLGIASRIKELLSEFQVTDKETGLLRPVKYSDMVILLRTNNGWDEDFKKVLEKEGIPVSVTSKTGYFSASEVQNLLQFLRVLDNPRQDVALFGVMRSVFGGFTEEEIAILRSSHRQGCLFEVLQQIYDGKEAKETASLIDKVKAFYNKIIRYRSDTIYMPIRELLQKLVNETGYLDYVTALPMGSKRKANIEMLFTKASDFEKTSYHGLFHFIRYMEQLEKYDVDFGEADFVDENADVVRIMSIHKSKGLEFPVTFVAGLSKRFNMQDVNQSLIIDADLGIGTDFVDVTRRVRNKTIRKLALACKVREDNLAEELRVLYVALTRAKEKLIMTAYAENAQEQWEKQKVRPAHKLQYHEFMESSSFLDLVLPVVDNAEVSVKVIVPNSLDTERKEQVQLNDKRIRLNAAHRYADERVLDEVRTRFAYQYPHKALENLYTKTTVSELKIAAMAQKDEAAYHAFAEQEIVPYIPKFKRSEDKISNTSRGNAFHKIMELIDFAFLYQNIFKRCPDSVSEFKKTIRQNRKILYDNLRQFIDQATCSGRLSQEYRGALNDTKLIHFLENDLSYRMYRAYLEGKLYREQPFVYGISANRLGQEYPQEEKVLIQGIIDAYFVEEGQIVLVDYKTDVIGSGEELWERYETQVLYYEEALCRLTGLPVKQKILYSFYLEQCVEGKSHN